jgi:small subunit ribosomal protein S6
MYPYEGMFLVDPNKYTEDPEVVEGEVKTLLEKHGANIVQFERWDDRKLAYEIDGHKRGVYLLTHFEMPGDGVDAMARETRIIDSILRQLVVRLDDDIPTFLEKSAKYSEVMREDQEQRRLRREESQAAGGRDRDGGGYRDRDDHDSGGSDR